MNGVMRIAFSLALLPVAALWALPTTSSDAQCRLCEQPSTAVEATAGGDDDLQLQIETNLNFDRLILLGSGMGAITLRPNGSSGVEGIVAAMGPRAMVGTVSVHGDPNRAVRIELPRRIELRSLNGGQMTLDDVASDAPAAPRLDPAGNLSFRFGGRLLVSGDVDGQYRGELPITVEYL
jgi:hypothetical protein